MSPERWLKIESVFEGAVELSPSDRLVFLAEECGSDASLRAEVEKLLASDEAAKGFIESPVWTDSSFLNTTAKKAISDSLNSQLGENGDDNFLGRNIGPYRLTNEIGRGGMGAVYLAERADGEFSQRVAIKLIKRGMDSDFIIRRFRHERQILASFEHPFIARLLDGGTTSDSVPYFVMEFIEGQTLYNYCDAKRLSIRDRLKIFQKICSAIEYAHEKQIIHRDIKPSNILINRLGSPKLLDFGIAKILDPNLVHESINPTASMLRMMTPDYASPEQVQGIDVTPSSDIYSLGILLYELLTGHRPYNFAGRALHEVSRVICELMPEVPSKIILSSEHLLPNYTSSPGRYLDVRSTSQKQLAQELAKNIDDIVMKALSKDPADRYASAGELSRDITRHLRGERIEAPHFAGKTRSVRDKYLRTSENSKAIAVLPFKFLNLGGVDDTDDQFLGLGLADALIARLSKVRRFAVRPTSSIISFGDDLADPIKAGADLNVDFILDGNIKKAGNRLRVTVQLLSVAENAAVWATSIDETLSDVLTLEDTLANKVIEVLLPQLTGSELREFAKRGTEVPEAFEHYLRGRYHFNTFTEDGFARAFVSFHSAIAADPKYALAYTGIADYYNWLGIVGVLPPQECFQPAIEAATKALELDEDLSDAHASLGFSLHSGNYEWSRAETHLQRALELNPNNASAYVWYSIVLYTEGRFTEGLEFARRGADLDPLTPFNHHNIAWGLYFSRRYDEAAERYRKVILDFPGYSFGYYGISKIHRMTGETQSALAENARAVELMGSSVFSLLAEAECYAADGQADVALEKIEKLKVLARDRYVSPYQLSLSFAYLAHRATTESDRLKYRALALDCLEKAAEIREAWLNWMGVEPAFDSIRSDPRFDDLLEKAGYRMFFSAFSSSGTNLSPAVPSNGRRETNENAADLHDLTTIVIEAGHQTADGATEEFPVKGRERRLWAVAAGAALIIAAAVGGYSIYQWTAPQIPAAVARSPFQSPAIVILPFKSSNAEERNLGIGLADSLSNKLGHIKTLQVISASSGRAFADADNKAIADGLGASFVVRGELSRTGDATTLTATMVNGSDGEAVWTEQFTAEDSDLFGLQTRVAEKIWTSLGIEPLPLERHQLYKSYTQNARAYEQYLIGRYLMANRSRENLRKAIETFLQAAEQDPGFALPYVGLADAYALLNLYDVEPPEGAYDKARENALKAVAVADELADAHAALAYIKFYHDRDRQGAELDFRRAIQVNPSYAQAHHWFALVLAAMGKPVDALSEAEIAQRLDPSSPSIKAATGIVYFMSGRNAEAVQQCDAALALDPSFVPALKVKRWVYTASGDLDNALANFRKEMAYSGGSADDPGWKILRLQMIGPDDERSSLLAELERVVKSPSVGRNDFAFAFEAALAFNALGETQKALDWLQRSEAAGGHSFNFLEVDPRLDNLRSEPRFIKLVEALR